MKQAQWIIPPRASLLRRLVAGWNQFWFNPGDPTTLGLIRICAGIMVLYIHLAYTYDLQTLLGEHAWLDLETVNAFRLEAPIVGLPTGWDLPLAPRPTAPGEEQQYWDQYVSTWGVPPPLPYPKTQEEADAIGAFRKKWTVDPRQAVARGRYLWSVWFHVTDPTWMSVIHAGILIVMFLFTIGFCTRITSVLTWMSVLCYIQRAPTTLFGMDTIMIILILYLMIGPSGAALSVDRLLTRWWARRQALRRHASVPYPSRPQPSVSANLALRLMQVHLCIVYLASGLSKLQGSSWWTGNAVWGTMANYEFSPMRSELYVSALRFLGEHRWLWELHMSGGTMFTLIFEISFAFLVWNPRLRWTMVVMGVLLHTGIAIFMGLVTFSLMMMILLLSFVPGAAVTQFLRVLGRWVPGLGQLAPTRLAVAEQGASFRSGTRSQAAQERRQVSPVVDS